MANDPIQTAAEMVKRVRINTVHKSLLWIMPFLLASLIVVSFGNNIPVQHFIMYLTGADVGIFLISFVCILIWGDKKLLHSEEHTFMMRALDILGDQKNTYKNIESLISENNPDQADPKTEPPILLNEEVK
jgi:hypothetical protein